MVNENQKNIRVIVRVRPNNRRELDHNQRTVIKVIGNSTLLFDPDEDDDEFFFQGVKQPHRDITKRVNKKLTMEFDKVFDGEATNTNVFEDGTKPLVEAVMNGYNCSVFVYGATGAGKTFTMLGSEEAPGITFLTMRELFSKINNLTETRKFDIGISYLEVYNEQVMNLLTKSGPLKLREDANGVVVSGLVLKPITNAEELLNLLALGNRNRTQHPTDANSESSRSHAIFQVHIRMTEKKTGQKRTVKLSMIDLAGSERAASTKGIGLRFKEGASINKSLLALGNCINKLADGCKHVPYRDSQLTRILKDSLGGNCQTVMIANVSPSSLTYEDTYNTLKYASRAKKIRTTIRQNIMKSNMPKEYYVKKVSELMDELEQLKETSKQLEIKVAANSASTVSHFDESELKCWYRKVDAVYSAVIKSQEYFYGLHSKEKLLRFKIKLNQKALAVNGLKAEKEIARVEASVSRYAKQIEKQRQDLVIWSSRYNESLKDLDKLRSEIKGIQYSTILEMYIKGKDAEVQVSQQHIKTNHITKINTLYIGFSEKLLKSIHLGCEIINNLSKNSIDSETQGSIEKLAQQLSVQNSVQFANDDSDESEEDHNFLAFSFDESEESVDQKGKRNFQSDDNGMQTTKRRKKMLFKSDDLNSINNCLEAIKSENDHKFKPPPSTNLNETHVLTVPSEGEAVNLTFHMPDKVAKNGKKDTDFLKSILTDQNVIASNRTAISKALIRSNITQKNLLSKVAAGINKENKKYSPNSNRIRKSPRPAVRNVTSRALNSATNFLNRQRTKSATTAKSEFEGPSVVRINRTASMRVKKH